MPRSSTLATFLVVTYYVLDDIVVTYIFDHIIVTCYVFDHIIVIFLIILSTGEMNTLTTQCNAVTTQRELIKVPPHIFTLTKSLSVSVSGLETAIIEITM